MFYSWKGLGRNLLIRFCFVVFPVIFFFLVSTQVCFSEDENLTNVSISASSKNPSKKPAKKTPKSKVIVESSSGNVTQSSSADLVIEENKKPSEKKKPVKKTKVSEEASLSHKTEESDKAGLKTEEKKKEKPVSSKAVDKVKAVKSKKVSATKEEGVLVAESVAPAPDKISKSKSKTESKKAKIEGDKKSVDLVSSDVPVEENKAMMTSSSKSSQKNKSKKSSLKSETLVSSSQEDSGVTKTTKKTSVKSKNETAQEQTQTEKPQKEDGGKPDVGLVGGDEEDKNVNDIAITGASVKEITIAGIKFTGNFIQQSPGVYLVQGELKPDTFKISLGAAAGQLKVDKNRDRIEGEMYITVPVYGKMIQITDLILSKTQIKFKGKFEQKVKIPVVHADLSLAKGIADFELSSSRIACQANGGFIIDVSIPSVGELSFEVVSGDAGFATSIPPDGISVSGSGTVTIPFEPPIEVDLEGSAQITKTSLSGNGSATLFSVLEVGNGSFDIGYNGLMTIDANVGAFLKDYGLEASMASTKMAIDLKSRKLTASLSQSIKILDLVTIPGSTKGELVIDGKAKLLSISGAAGVPLTASAVGPEKLSVGIKNFLFKLNNFNSKSSRTLELNGDLYVSVWTFAGFNGKVEGNVLNGKGNFYLPPGLKQLLDIDKVSLPVKVDLKAAEIMGDLGGDVAGLAIKHFPLEGPQLIVKNDGIHLKGQIGIANVVTIPLGDLVFTQNSSSTTVNADIGLGPFTLAEGNFSLPTKDNEPIGFSGKIGIPGLSAQKLSGSLYTDGKLDFSGLTKIGFINVKTLGKFSVSKSSLHADAARFGLGLGGAAECALTFTSLDLTPSKISGRATGSFTGVLGIGTALSGNFSFDGKTVELSYPEEVSLCGIGVRKVKLLIGIGGVTGSGEIAAAGMSKNVTISLENGILKLKGPAGELIAEGMNIAGQLKDTVTQTASEEKEVVAEDANATLDNLSRMSEPWIKDMVAVVSVAKKFYNSIEQIVKDEILARLQSALNDLKKEVDAAVAFAKNAIDGAVDAVCNGINALVDGVDAIFAKIESLIPSQYSGTYQTVKNKIKSKAATLKQQVVSFRTNTKNSLYRLTDTIASIYQGAIDMVTGEANKVAAGIKKQVDPLIKEMDQLLTEVGQEIRAAKNAAGEEATQHYEMAREKANLVKEKANNIINNYKNKISDLVAPYIKSLSDAIAPYKARVVKERDAVIAKSVEGLKTAKAALDPYIQPFEDALAELNTLVNNIGGAVAQKFLEGVSAAGSALNTALGTAGKGLVKATDVLGDGVVAASNAAAQASQTVHNAAQGAANAASQAASQTYAAASQVYNTVQQQASSTVSNVVHGLSSIPSSSFATGNPVSFSQLQSGAVSLSSKVTSILSKLDGYGSSVSGAASGAVSSVGSAISNGASTVSSGVSTGWRKATGALSGLFGGSSGTSAPPLNFNAPEISNIAASATTDSITVTWNTSFSSRTIIFYSTEPNVNTTGASATTKVASLHTGDVYPETTSHSITVTGLTSGTQYYYIVYSVHSISGGSTNAAKKGPYPVVTQPSTAVIGGTVKDISGKALVGVGLYVDGVATSAATTDAAGQYVIEVNPGVRTIVAKKDNYINSQAQTASLVAGQILPLDFNLAEGKILVSGSVKDAASNAGLAGANVMLSGLSVPMNVSTDAGGAFSATLNTTGGSAVSLVINVTKAGYASYQSQVFQLAPGAKMQNVEFKLPKVLPSLSGSISALNPTTDHIVISFHTSSDCSAFVQFGPQSNAGYLYQTPSQGIKNDFSFDLRGLTAATGYKYRIILQDNSGSTVIAKEGTLMTSSVNNTATSTSQNTSGGQSSASRPTSGRPTAI